MKTHSQDENVFIFIRLLYLAEKTQQQKNTTTVNEENSTSTTQMPHFSMLRNTHTIICSIMKFAVNTENTQSVSIMLSLKLLFWNRPLGLCLSINTVYLVECVLLGSQQKQVDSVILHYSFTFIAKSEHIFGW